MRLRAELRSRWRAWLTLAVLAGLGAGVVSATVAGAKRTDSAASRYQATGHAFDVYVVAGRGVGAGLLARRAAAPGRAVHALGRPPLLGTHRRGRPVTVNEAVLNAPINGLDGGHPRNKFVAGRAPDPASPDEIYVGSRRPTSTTCEWEAPCGCGSPRRERWRGSSRPASTTRWPTPRPRAAGRSSPCASSGFASRSNPRTSRR